MKTLRNVNDTLLWVGGNDHRLALFENAYPLTNGVSYNSYLSLDEKTVLLDTVDPAVEAVFLENVEAGLAGRKLDYLIVSHMEPDHAGTLATVCKKYPEATIIVNQKTTLMISQFFGDEFKDRYQIVKEGDTLTTGEKTFTFMMAPMVHWPEVMVCYEESSKTLFSADAFGTFGAISGFLFADEVDFARDWAGEARRYYANIVGKYGAPVQTLLKKASKFDIACICPLHGPIWRKDIAWFVDKYQKWSTYTPEDDAVLVAYASVYGNTKLVAEMMANDLRNAGAKDVRVYDVSNTHVSELISESFRVSKIALLSATYNAGIFPAMENFLHDFKAHSVQNRTIALVENGSWALSAGKQMNELLTSMKGISVLPNILSIKSTIQESQYEELTALATALWEA